MKVATLNEVLATREKMRFRYRINFEKVQYSNMSQMIAWCRDNCKGLWRVEKTHALYFQFDEDTDATMFMLKWGGKEGNELKGTT